MNLLTKALIVINLVFSSAFCVYGLSLYVRQVNWVQVSQESIVKRNELTKQRDELEKRLTEKSAAFDELNAKTSQQIEAMKADLAKRGEEKSKLAQETVSHKAHQEEWKNVTTKFEADVTAAQERNDRIEKEKSAAIDQLNKAVNDRDFAQKAALEVTADLKATEEELVAATKRSTELMEEVLQMRAMLDKIRTRVPDLATLLVDSESAGVPVQGKVVSVHEAVDLVMLNVGQNDKLKPGMKLVISRGDKYVGRVIVRSVYENMSSAVIDKPVMRLPIREGDVAETL